MSLYDVALREGGSVTTCDPCLDEVLRRPDALVAVTRSASSSCEQCGAQNQPRPEGQRP